MLRKCVYLFMLAVTLTLGIGWANSASAHSFQIGGDVQYRPTDQQIDAFIQKHSNDMIYGIVYDEGNAKRFNVIAGTSTVSFTLNKAEKTVLMKAGEYEDIYQLNTKGIENGPWRGSVQIGSPSLAIYVLPNITIGEETPYDPTAGEGLADTLWPSQGYNNRNTSQSPYLSPYSPILEKKTAVPGLWPNDPIVGKSGELYYEDSQKKLHAIRDNDEPLWSIGLEGSTYGGLALGSDLAQKEI